VKSVVDQRLEGCIRSLDQKQQPWLPLPQLVVLSQAYHSASLAVVLHMLADSSSADVWDVLDFALIVAVETEVLATLVCVQHVDCG
jgi:hypothetical protein